MTKKHPMQSLPNLLKILWQEGFFSDEKSIWEVKKALSIKGYNFPSSSLSVALMRLVRQGSFLSRVKDTGKWKYIQKHPNNVSVSKRTELFCRYDFHPRVKEVAFKQFEDGYFKEAIQNALVEVINQVKVKTGYPKNSNGRDLDGDDLMNHVFGCDSQEPKIRFNALTTSLDKTEQRGLMNLFRGIVGIRDKKAHLNFIQNDPLKTVEYLSLSSLLLRLLDEHTTA